MIYKFNVVVGNDKFRFTWMAARGASYGYYWILCEGHTEGEGALVNGKVGPDANDDQLRKKAHDTAWKWVQDWGMVEPRYEPA